MTAKVLWRLPGLFEIVKWIGPSYTLRSVVFHDIRDEETSFTRGMGVSITPRDFGAALEFIAARYTPVHLQDVLDGRSDFAKPPVLVTFDDGYASVATVAAPLCRRLGMPAIVFLNGAVLDNRRLAPDNLVCFAVNVLGLGALNHAVQTVRKGAAGLRSLADVFSCWLPSLSTGERRSFLDELRSRVGRDERELAADARLYLTVREVQSLPGNFEIGNHTYSHVHCRTLGPSDLGQELDGNQAVLAEISGRRIRSFSVPYGSHRDLPTPVVRRLQATGHQAVFLSESVANAQDADPLRLDRVSVHANSGDVLFSDLEVFPRLRALRNRLRRASIHGG